MLGNFNVQLTLFPLHPILYGTLVWFIHNTPVSQSVGYFTVPPRAHPSTGSQSGSATPGLTQVPSILAPGGYSIVASEVNLGQSQTRKHHSQHTNAQTATPLVHREGL